MSNFTKEYDAPFSIRSHEEGKKFHYLLKWKFILPKFFNDDVLYDIGVEEDMILLSDELGWTKFFRMKLDTFYELILEFYTTFKYIDDGTYMFSYRFFGREFHVDYDLMSHIFGFLKRGVTLPLKDFDMLIFWRKIS